MNVFRRRRVRRIAGVVRRFLCSLQGTKLKGDEKMRIDLQLYGHSGTKLGTAEVQSETVPRLAEMLFLKGCRQIQLPEEEATKATFMVHSVEQCWCSKRQAIIPRVSAQYTELEAEHRMEVQRRAMQSGDQEEGVLWPPIA